MSRKKDNSTKWERDRARFLYLRKENARYYKHMSERFANFDFKEEEYNKILNQEVTRENVKEELRRDKVSKDISNDILNKIDLEAIRRLENEESKKD